MCKPEPGPRCSGHTKAKLDGFVQQRNKKAATLREFIQENNNSVPKPGDSGYSKYQRLKNSVSNADLRVSAALEDYRTTPSGLNQMFSSYTGSVTRGNAVEAEKWRSKLLKSWETRKQQMQAYRVMEAERDPFKTVDDAEFTQVLSKYDLKVNALKRAHIAKTGNQRIIDLLIKDPNPVVRRTLLDENNLTPQQMIKLATDEDRAVQEKVLEQNLNNPAILKILGKSAHSQVRAAVARNHATGDDVLKKMGKDENRNVRRSAAKTLKNKNK